MAMVDMSLVVGHAITSIEVDDEEPQVGYVTIHLDDGRVLIIMAGRCCCGTIDVSLEETK